MRTPLTALALVLATPVFGGIEHTILHGVSVAGVRASVGPDAVPGLTSEALRVAVESRLRAAGLRLDPSANAVLLVNATTMLGNSGTCFFRLEARLVEEARLERNGFLVKATSWSSGGDGLADVGGCAKGVTDVEEKAVDDFVEHYHAMNPASAAAR
jgi:hypothetical protein